MKLILASISAGISISIGCIAFLSSGLPWTFPIGLFIVCSFNLMLFTGKICYAESDDIGNMLVCLLFNVLASLGMGFLIRYSKPVLIPRAVEMVNAKLNEGLALIPLAILCNVLIFVAVESYKREDLSPVIRLFGLYFATAIFVTCGFEHCVANAFYIGLAGNIGWKSISYLAVNAIFNAVGGITAHRVATTCRGLL